VFSHAPKTASYNRGLAYHELRQYERAVQDFDQAIRLKENKYVFRGSSADRFKG